MSASNKEMILWLAMDEVYSLITASDSIPWPASLEDSNSRIEFLQILIQYFEMHEEYERCAILNELIVSMRMNNSFKEN
jgi:hypothetical protein